MDNQGVLLSGELHRPIKEPFLLRQVKKRFNLENAKEDLELRQKIYNETKSQIENMYKTLQDNYEVMTMTLPDDKKAFVKKEIQVIMHELNFVTIVSQESMSASNLFIFSNQALTEKLECLAKFGEKVAKIEDFVTNLDTFNKGLVNLDNWMKEADQNLHDIKEKSDEMTPEDRVSYTMELQEDVGARVKLVQELIAKEETLLPQGLLYIRSCCYSR